MAVADERETTDDCCPPIAAQSSPAAKPRRAWWGMRVFVIVSILLVGGMAAGPWIIAKTELRHRLIPVLCPALGPNARIDEAELDWWSPVVLRGVSLSDPALAPGEPATPWLTIREIRAERRLWQWGVDRTQLGTIHVTAPVVRVKTTRETSNLETLLARFANGESTSTLGSVTVEIHDADLFVSGPVITEPSAIDGKPDAAPRQMSQRHSPERLAGKLGSDAGRVGRFHPVQATLSIDGRSGSNIELHARVAEGRLVESDVIVGDLGAATSTAPSQAKAKSDTTPNSHINEVGRPELVVRYRSMSRLGTTTTIPRHASPSEPTHASPSATETVPRREPRADEPRPEAAKPSNLPRIAIGETTDATTTHATPRAEAPSTVVTNGTTPTESNKEPPATTAPLPGWSLYVSTREWDLAPLAGLLVRAGLDEPALSGRLTVDLEGTSTIPTGNAGTADRRVEPTHAAAASGGTRSAEKEAVVPPTQLRGDMRCERVVMTWRDRGETRRAEPGNLSLALRIASDSDCVAIHKGSLRGDGWSADLKGELDHSAWAQLAWDAKRSPVENAQRLGQTLTRRPLSLRGQSNLVRLAETCRDLLPLKQGVTLTGGRAELSLETQQAGHPNQWQTEVRLAELAAVTAQGPFRLDEPVTLRASGHASAAVGLLVRNLQLQGDFFDVSLQGEPHDLRLQGRADLTRLCERLRQYVDLDGLECRGHVTANGRWQSPEGGRLNGELSAEVRDFEWRARGVTPWQEPRLTVQSRGEGMWKAGDRQPTWERASLALSAEGDALQVTLPAEGEKSAVEKTVFERTDNERTSGGEARRDRDAPRREVWGVLLTGRLERWLPRLRYVLGRSDLTGTGDVRLQSRITSTGDVVDVETLRLDLTQFYVATAGVHLRDPSGLLEGRGRLMRADGSFAAPQLAWTSPSARATVRDVKGRVGPTGSLEFTSLVESTADLDRAGRWRHPPHEPGPVRILGQAVVTGDLMQQAETLRFTGTARVTNATVAMLANSGLTQPGFGPPGGGQPFGVGGAKPTWEAVASEPSVECAGGVQFDTRTGEVGLNDFRWNSRGLELTVKGRVRPRPASLFCDLRGTARYDWQVLRTQWQPLVGENVQLAGQQNDPFTIQGDIPWSQEGSGAATVLAAKPVPGEATTGVVADEAWQPLTGNFRTGWSAAIIHGLALGPANVQGQMHDGRLTVNPLSIAAGEGKLHLAPQVAFLREGMLVEHPAGLVAERIHLSPEMCARGLQYIAPLLAGSARTQGRFSLETDGARVPWNAFSRMESRGRLHIHGARVQPGAIIGEILSATRTLRDLIKQRLPVGQTGEDDGWATLPEQVVDYEVRDGRLKHSGFALTLGPISLRTQGTVGLDSSMDVLAELTLPANFADKLGLRGDALTRPLQIPIRGSLAKPEVAGGILEGLFKQEAGQVIEKTIDNLLEKPLNRLFPKGR